MLGLCPNVITVDYQEDSRVAATVIANLPRFVANIRRNIPTPIMPAEGGPWAIMSSRGRYLEVKVHNHA